MHPDDGRLIARLQTLTTELLADKRSGRWRAERVNELCRARLELEQRDLKNSPEYRDVMLRADQQHGGLWSGRGSPPPILLRLPMRRLARRVLALEPVG